MSGTFPSNACILKTVLKKKKKQVFKTHLLKYNIISRFLSHGRDGWPTHGRATENDGWKTDGQRLGGDPQSVCG